jgi:hypothetical protein
VVAELRTSHEARAFVLRRNWAVPLFGLALLVGGVLVGTSHVMDPLYGWLAAWIGLFLAPVALLRNAYPRAEAVVVRATNGSLAISGRAEIPADEVVEGKLMPRLGRGVDTVLELGLRNGRAIALWLKHADGHALLSLLGDRRTSFPLMLRFHRRFAATSFVLATLWVLESMWNGDSFWTSVARGAFSLGLVSLVLATVVGFLRGRLVIGADGFTTKWLRRERYHAFRDVVRMTAVTPLTNRYVVHTVVELRSGEMIRLVARDAPNDETQRGAESRALYAHMAAAHQRSLSAARDAEVDVRALVARGARSPREWLAGLDGLMRGGAVHYRVAAVAPEMLVEVARDPNGVAEARIGAAAALVRCGDPAQRVAVRVAADACADPAVRAAMIELADAVTDESFESALARSPRPR